jgi:uncharacterized membrane protein (UPF0127 family)
MKSNLHESARSSAKPAPRRAFRVSNVTRGTALAACVEIADTGPARRKGLLGRGSLSTGEGLWITPCESVHTWFMHFPIDLVYLSREKRIEKLRSDVVPWRLSACLSAGSVLELAAGSIRASRSEQGDIVEFSSVTLAGDDVDSSTKS